MIAIPEKDTNNLKEIIVQAKKPLIITHYNPDGDAIGSALAFYHYLIKKGKDPMVVTPNDYPEFLHWLPGNDKVVVYKRNNGTVLNALKEADVISLHVPETPQTKNMMGAAEFEVMKDGVVFINASRGTVVDIDALAEALANKKVAGAAIDVFPIEPKSNEEEFISPLRAFDNVILTPHIGGSTKEAQENIGLEVASKLAKYSDNGSTLSAVNFPEVSLPSHVGTSRLLHIHHNQPGVLTQINQAFAKHDINIAAQYLQTADQIGYVVIDIEAENRALALKELKQIEATIRVRLLH